MLRGESAKLLSVGAIEQILLRFIKAYFTDVPLLATMVAGEIKQEGFSLTNGIDIKAPSQWELIYLPGEEPTS